MTRAKQQVTELLSREQTTAEMQRYAEATSQKKELEAQIEQKIQAVREQHAVELQNLMARQQAAFEKLKYFSEFNKERYFAKKKSIDMVHGVMGFRIGTPKVKAVKTTLAKALEALKAARMKRYIRTKEEINRDEIIQSRDNVTELTKLNALGLIVVQEETFYVEPKEEK